MKKRKRISEIITVVILTTVFLGSTSVSAADPQVGIQSDTSHYYEMQNKTYKNTTKELNKYITNMWAKASSYSVTDAESRTISLTASATSGSFPTSDVKATGSFTVSRTRSFSVGITIPSNSSKYSKLTIESSYKNHTGKLYYVIDYGHKRSLHYRDQVKLRNHLIYI